MLLFEPVLARSHLEKRFSSQSDIFFKLPTDKNLPNSSSVEVEVTPPMNGTAGQEGETVRSRSTQNLHAKTAYYSKFGNLSESHLTGSCYEKAERQVSKLERHL